MKFKKLKTKSVVATGVSVLGAGVGSAVADWALEKYGVDSKYEKSTLQAAKIIGGAVLGSIMPTTGYWPIAKSAFDGIATVAAAELVKEWLPEHETKKPEKPEKPETEPGAGGLPYGMIGGRHGMRMGQRGFARRAVAGTPNALMSK